ncbi:MAG: alpha/beta fold hydrolase [Solirubrobacteraceae bacterium]
MSSPFPICAPPGTPNGLLDSWYELWAGAGLEVLEEIEGVLTRGTRLLDLPRWWQLVTTRESPSWATPNEVVFETPLARLRDFSTDPASELVPVLVLPPQAGHDSCIVDYSPGQSQMHTIVQAGLPRALSLDWLGATAATADASIDDYLDVIDRAVEHVGGRVNLIGDCQGGWLATLYAALEPERINTLTIAGAPIDFHAGEPIVHEVLRHLAPGGDTTLYKALIAQAGGVLKGDYMVTGFVMIKPIDELKRQLALLRHLDDQAHVERYREFENWFKHTQDIPGAFYLWIIEHLFRDNELVSRSLRVRDRIVDLRALDMPINLLAGANDHITPPDQVFALAHEVSTPPELIRHEITGGGHLGLFMGHEALRDHWPVILEAIREHSAG